MCSRRREVVRRVRTSGELTRVIIQASVPLLLGIRTIALAIRTALPAGGLLIVIGMFPGSSSSVFFPFLLLTEPAPP